MKIELEKITLGYSDLSEEIYAGVLNKAGNKWLNKKNVTNEFTDCVIRKYEGMTTTVSSGSDKWEITVKKILDE